MSPEKTTASAAVTQNFTTPEALSSYFEMSTERQILKKNHSFLISFSRITCRKVKLCCAIGPIALLLPHLQVIITNTQNIRQCIWDYWTDS